MGPEWLKYKNTQVTHWTYEAKDESLRNSNADAPALVLIHGGPAATSNYFIPLKYLACSGRKVRGDWHIRSERERML